jgi:site-specific DNA-methyltransferase (adenine-specific)
MKLTQIKITDRFRKDLGDVQSLADSIKRIGLLHPIVVTPDRRLIAGRRRIAAFELLGRTEIPATVVDIKSLAEGERDENTERKDFTPSEAVAIWQAMEAHSGARTDKQPRGNLPRSSQRRDKAAAAVGLSAKTLSKAKAVVESGYKEIIERMDSTGNVDAAMKEIRARKLASQRAEIAAAAATVKPSDRWQVHHADMKEWQTEKKYDWIITDPPYPKEYLPLYETLAIRANDWLKEGGLLVAMCGQSYLNEIYAMMSKHLTYYWTACYLTPGACAAMRQVNVNTQWKPLLIFGKGKYTGKIFGDVFRSEANDKDFHKWGQSVSGMVDIVSKLTLPGQSILDPFCGAGTTGIAALRHGCLFTGLELDAENHKISMTRLAEESR